MVNAANAETQAWRCVAGAIHRAAGPELAKACEPLVPIGVGEAVTAPAFNLPNRFVIHCLGPIYGRDEPAEILLATCCRQSLAMAEEAELGSIAFPAVSTGVFGYPLAEAAEVACRTVVAECPQLRHLALIRFVLWEAEAHTAFAKALEAAVGGVFH